MYSLGFLLIFACLVCGGPLVKLADRLAQLGRGSIRSVCASLDAESIDSFAEVMHVDSNAESISAALNERLRGESRSYTVFILLQSVSEHALGKLHEAVFGNTFYAKRLALKNENDLFRFNRWLLIYSTMSFITSYAAYRSPTPPMILVNSGLAFYSLMKSKHYYTLMRNIRSRQNALKLAYSYFQLNKTTYYRDQLNRHSRVEL